MQQWGDDPRANPDATVRAATDGKGAPGLPNEEVLLALVDLARDQARDLTRQNDELRRKNEALEQADRHKTEFLTTVTHELRTPLNSILGFSELLLEGLAGPLASAQADYVRDISQAGTRLLALINDLLDLAKASSGKMDFRSELLDLRAPVSEAAATVQALALRSEQKLTVDLSQPVLCVGDYPRIRQVALNLLSNAVKFTPRGGAVTARVRTSEADAVLEVTDSGIGIAREHHGLIFEAFRQVDSSDARTYPGTGLGLALVARFCEGMGGSVRVDSELGRGATFTVRLPAPKPVSRRVVGLYGRNTGPALAAALHGLGYEVDELGPLEAFALRPGTTAVLVDAPTSHAALAAVRRIRSLRELPAPTVLVLQPRPDETDGELASHGAELFRGTTEALDELWDRLRELTE